MWIVEHADGSVSQHHDKPGTRGIDRGMRFAKLPREIDLGHERWDFAAGRVVSDAAGRHARIDAGHLADHGPLAIALAHIEKRIEARLILAGVSIDGLVAAEARAIGVTAPERAEAIVAAAAEAHAIEIGRIVRKQGDGRE